MSIKDLFGKNVGIKGSQAESLESVARSIEGPDLTTEVLKERQRYIPRVDLSDPANFSRYGSAARYYGDAFDYIADTYPYDGSQAERLEWENSASIIDLYVFENEYPRSTGYIHLGRNYGTVSTSDNGYGDEGGSPEHILFKGNLVTASTGMEELPLADTFENSNIYNPSSGRENNLTIDGADGVTLEFWLHKSSSVVAESDKQVIFDVWNSQSFGSSGYGRFRLEVHPGTAGEEDSFYFELVSGTDGAGYGDPVELGTNLPITSSTWHHYAISFQNTGSALIARLYQDGELLTSITTGSSIGEVTGTLTGMVGAMVAPISGTDGQFGWGKLSGSLDELRFWKTRRTAEQIGRNWFTQVGGGANTDDAQVDLGLYYKFNEGITATEQDFVVLDYSGRVGNGYWVGYQPGNRGTGSAILEAEVADREFQDPIIYTFHPDFIANRAALVASGTVHDDTNNSVLYNSFPFWVVNADQLKGRKVLENLAQTIGSYFDELHLQIEALPRIKDREYTTGSSRPRPFAQRFLESAGYIAPDILEDAFALEAIGNRNNTAEFEEKFYEVRDRIYENIYNNLVHVNKLKGTEDAARNLIRAFGVGDEIIRLNLYANDIDLELKDRFRQVVVRSNVVDFNDPDRWASTVYGTSGTDGGVSYIAFNSSTIGYAQTFECDAVFPRKFDVDNPLYFATSFVTSNVFGCNRAELDSTDFGYAADNNCAFHVQAIRTEVESKDAYFQLLPLELDSNFPTLTSSVFKDVYDNERWIFSVTVKHQHPFGNTITGAADIDYFVEFRGYNYLLDVEQNSFVLTSSIPEASGAAILAAPKRMYVGSLQSASFTSSQEIFLSDVKVNALRVWAHDLDEQALIQHAKDPSNFGTLHPYRPIFLSASLSGASERQKFQIPEMASLCLHWNFENVTGSGPNSDGTPTTSDAGFFVDDISSGSSAILGQVPGGWSSFLNTSHPATGAFYLPNSADVVQREYFNAAKLQLPDVASSDDLIKIKNESEEYLEPRSRRPIEFYYALEKSMQQVISDQMINWFGTVRDFNNLIGEPAERYQQEYKRMKQIRQLFFDKVANEPDFEKFVEYFKWVDDSIARLVFEVLPASANFSPEVRTVIESHILERNKYFNKPPTIEFKAEPPIDNISPIVVVSTKQASPGNAVTAQRSWDRAKVISVRNVKDTNAAFVTDESLTRSYTPFGNYGEDYEIINTTGRTENNRFLTDSASFFGEQTQTLPISATNLPVDDYAAPSRSTTNSGGKHVFASRFSAPGDPLTLTIGSLDLYASEYSAYNSMNFRNLDVRDYVAERYQAHMSQTTFLDSIEPLIPNVHKVNRNPRTAIRIGSDGIPYTGSIFNNGFFQTPIPSSDVSYAWVAHSLDTASLQPLGYVFEYSVPSASTSINPSRVVFVTSSVLVTGGVQSFVGTADLIADPVSLEDGFIGISGTGRYENSALNTVPQPFELHLLNLKRNGPYQGAGWKMIRGFNNPVIRLQRRNNVIGIIDEITEKQLSSSAVVTKYRVPRPDSITQFNEPAVVFKYKPLVNVFEVRGSREPIVVEHTYANNIANFTNIAINQRLGLEDCEPQMYDRLKELYVETDLDPNTNPVQGFVKFSYEETIFPKEINTGRAIVRGRTQYKEDAPTDAFTVYSKWPASTQVLVEQTLSVGSYLDNDLDRPPLERRTFWHSDPKVRNRITSGTAYTMQNQQGTALPIRPETHFTTLLNSQGTRHGRTTSVWPFGCEIFHTTSYQMMSESNQDFANKGENTHFNQTVDSNFDFGELDGGLMANPRAIMAQDPLRGDVDTVGEAWQLWFDREEEQLRRAIGGGGLSSLWPSYKVTASALYTAFSFPSRLAAPFGPCSAQGQNFAIGNEFMPIGPLRIGEEYIQYQDDFQHRFRIVAHTSGTKFPSYDSYEDFAVGIRETGKDYSTVPEFRISEHMEFYVDKRGGNFRARNDSFLEMIGSEITKSAPNESGSFSEEFFKKFAHSDELKYFETIASDHDSLGEVSHITLTCKGIKKLLPYNGLYPCLRTLQLASLFSQSLDGNIDGMTPEEANTLLPNLAADPGLFDETEIWRMRSALQPLFAPGILFNTIKAGIAVDWPVLTGTFQSIYNTGSGAGGQAPQASSGAIGQIQFPANYRIPFETLLDLKNGDGQGGFPVSDISSSKKINYLGSQKVQSEISTPDTSIKIPYFTWNGNVNSPLYSLGMNNFLGSTIDFFLQDSSLNAIYSNPEKEFKSFENGKAYYMDVVLRTTNDFLMYGGHWNPLNKFYFNYEILANGTASSQPSDPIISESLAPTYTGKFYGHAFEFYGDPDERVFSSGRLGTWNDPYGSTNDNGPTFSGTTWFGSGIRERFGQGIVLWSDPAFAPYLPSYFFERSILRIKYVADGTERQATNVISKIQSSLEFENLNPSLFAIMNNWNAAFSPAGKTAEDFTTSSAAWRSRQVVSSSVEIFGIAQGKQSEFSPSEFDNVTGRAAGSNVIDPNSSAFNRWVIFPKMEVPVLDFKNQPEEVYTMNTADGRIHNTASVFNGTSNWYDEWVNENPAVHGTGSVGGDPCSGSVHYIPRGMWSGYGEFLSSSSGIFLEVAESFTDLSDEDREATGSLIDVLGFDTSAKQIGRVAQAKQVFEAIVAIPFVDEPITDASFARTTRVVGKNVFSVSRENYEKQRSNVINGKPAVERNTDFGNVQKESTTISRMSQAMRKYVIPPEMNFELYDDINPFVMYFFEFDHTFDRQDLADIWQGVLPKIGTTPEKDEVTISHDSAAWEFFENKKLPRRIRWFIFKVKQRGEWSYFSKTADTRDDARFRFDFKTQQNIIPDYSYNWPYDFFSLVELAKIDAKIDIEPKRVDAPPVEDEAATPTGAREPQPPFIRDTAGFILDEPSEISRGLDRRRRLGQKRTPVDDFSSVSDED